MGSRYEKDQVVKIINSVIEKVGKSGDVSKDVIYGELAQLRGIIEDLKANIGMVAPADITGKHIPTATDELDAVVSATADATGQIMDACEAIENEAGAIGGEKADAITAHVTRIYEACSFQDITGQRIKKVVSALHAIDTKVGAIMNIMGDDGAASGTQSAEDDQGERFVLPEEKGLLNGPQMPASAITQADIDKLLEDFD